MIRTLRTTLVSGIIFFLGLGSFAESGGGAMRITSPEFEHNGVIPKKFTCQGADVNPKFNFYDIPEGAKSLALIVDDPDAPGGMWVHWVVFDIPLIKEVAENSVPGTQGVNDFNRKDYGGPCPPSGTHRYFFKIYALDTVLDSDGMINKKQLEEKMQGHILGRAEMIGLYKKEK